MKFTVRPAVFSDAAHIREINCGFGFDFSLENTEKSLENALAKIDSAVFSAVVSRSFAGYIHIRGVNNLYEDDFVELSCLAVREKFRNSGIGTALLKTAEQWCVQSFYKEIRFHGEAPELRAFLLKQGFEENSSLTKNLFS